MKAECLLCRGQYELIDGLVEPHVSKLAWILGDESCPGSGKGPMKPISDDKHETRA